MADDSAPSPTARPPRRRRVAAGATPGGWAAAQRCWSCWRRSRSAFSSGRCAPPRGSAWVRDPGAAAEGRGTARLAARRLLGRAHRHHPARQQRRAASRRAALAGARREPRQRRPLAAPDDRQPACRSRHPAARRGRAGGAGAGVAAGDAAPAGRDRDRAQASVGELRIGAGDDAFALRALRAGIHLGAEGGALHRFTALAGQPRARQRVGRGDDRRRSAVRDRRQGQRRLGRNRAGVAGERQRRRPARCARGRRDARGSPPAATQAAQSLDAKAVVRPFAAWPLGELQASTEALDLSAFASDAPATSLSGRATATTSGLDRPALIVLDLRNARAGRWNEGLLPVQRLDAELRARPDDPGTIEVQRLAAELGSSRLGGGRIAGSGRWTADRWNVELELTQLRPSALDARAPETALDGKLAAVGTGFAAATADAARVELRADLAGRLADRRLPRTAPQAARIRLEASGGMRELLLRSAEASLGAARATLAGRLSRASANAPWHASGRTALIDFDPAPWWPGATDSLLARGANRLNLKGEFDLDLPAASSAASAFQLLAATRGKATLALTDSQLAGVPLQGEASYANSNGDASATVELRGRGQPRPRPGAVRRQPGAGRVAAEHRCGAARPPRAAAAGARQGRGGRAAPWPARSPRSGRIEGRWPDLRSDGELQAAALRLGPLAVRRGDGRWRLGSAADAPMSGTLALDGVDLAGRPIERVRAELSGTSRAHKAELRIESQALPPEWVDAIATLRTAAATAPATPSATGRAERVHSHGPTRGQPQRPRHEPRRRPGRCRRRTRGRLERHAARAARAKPGSADSHLAARARAARQLLLERRPATRQPRAGQRRSARRDAALEPRRLAGGRRPRRQRPARGRRDLDPLPIAPLLARRRARLRLGRRSRRSRAGSRCAARRRCGWTRWSSAPAATSA